MMNLTAVVFITGICACRDSPQPTTRAASDIEIILTDANGLVRERTADPDQVGKIITLINSAPRHTRSLWKETDLLAKLTIKMPDGRKRRFVFFKPDQVVEMGVDPGNASRVLALDEIKKLF